MRRQFNFPNKISPTGYVSIDVINAHSHSSNNRNHVDLSEMCGCFYCGAIFPTDSITKWIDKVGDRNVTAMCPDCGTDAVLPSSSGYPIERDFLLKMRDYWFSTFGA